MPTTQIEELALSAIREHFGVEAHVQTVSGANNSIAVINGVKLDPYVVRGLRAGGLDGHLLKMKERSLRSVLIAEYINPVIAERLIGAGANYIDSIGNCYIREGALLLSAKGNKPQKPKAATPNKAFELAGMKLILGLLSDKELLNKPYREMAKVCDISLGGIGGILEGLSGSGFIQKSRKGTALITNQIKLLDRWAITYAEKIRPKLLIRIAGVDAIEKLAEAKLADIEGAFGGEIAAHHYIGNFLRPAEATIYIPESNLNELYKQRLIRGYSIEEMARLNKVEIYKPFLPNMPFAKQAWLGIANPVVVYADLMATGDSRNYEAAQEILNNVIARYIGED